MAVNIKERQLPGDQSRDPSIVELLTYNERAGARKSVEVGRALIPLGDGASGFTTNAATAPRILPSAGRNLAIYNNAGAVGSVTVGDNTMTSQAPGAVQISGSNVFVGVPCPPNSWTYLSSGQWNWVAASAATLLVFLIDDPTFMFTLPATNSSNPQQTTAPSGAPVNEPNT
jgi:hypothetical protein